MFKLDDDCVLCIRPPNGACGLRYWCQYGT
uniref:Uncharacterized protein n=1 Tax=Arundo donax TaxID=35708 RepID=A0A0A8ZXC9_ARUDO